MKAPMGYLLLFCFLVHYVKAMSDSQKSAIVNKFIAVGIQCVNDNPISLPEIKALKDKKASQSKNAKCFIACVFKKVGVMDDMGMLSPATTRKNAEQVFKGNEQHLKSVDEIMQICSAVNHQVKSDDLNECDRAQLAYTCLAENGPKYGFDFDF